MRLRKNHAAWALKLWVLGSVFLIPFLEVPALVAWGLLGGAFGLVWRALPEEPEAPAGKLPFHDRYAGREIPRPGEPPPPAS